MNKLNEVFNRVKIISNYKKDIISILELGTHKGEFAKELYNHFKPTGFNILTVNTDSPKSMSKVKPYVRTKGFEFNVAVDPNSQVKKRLKVQEMPTTILIDQDGTILYRHKGYVPGDEVGILKAITDILDKKGIEYAPLDLDKVQAIKKKEKLKIDF